MKQKKEVKIMLVDDSIDFVINFIEKEIQSTSDIKLLDTFSDGEEILEKLPNLEELPEVIILDERMQRLNGIPTARIIKKQYPQIKILFLTDVSENYKHIKMAIDLGVEGYVSKTEASYLIRGIREVSEGIIFMSPKINRTYFINQGRRSINTPKYRVSIEDLTEKDKLFLELLGQGKSFNEIQSEMEIGMWARRDRVNRLKTRLDIDSIQGLCAYAWRNSLCQ